MYNPSVPTVGNKQGSVLFSTGNIITDIFHWLWVYVISVLFAAVAGEAISRQSVRKKSVINMCHTILLSFCSCKGSWRRISRRSSSVCPERLKTSCRTGRQRSEVTASPGRRRRTKLCQRRTEGKMCRGVRKSDEESMGAEWSESRVQRIKRKAKTTEGSTNERVVREEIKQEDTQIIKTVTFLCNGRML